MAIVIGINGIPGSGKSQFGRAIAHHYEDVGEVVILNDYPILLSMCMEEQSWPAEQRRFQLRQEEGVMGFDIRDRSVLSLVLERLAAQVRQYLPERVLLLIEFARTSYAHVWDIFQPLENALFFFMHTPYHTCKERIHRRVLQSRYSDDRPLSEKAMSHYCEDGLASWMSACHGQRARVLDNAGDWDTTWLSVKPYLDEVVNRAIWPGLWPGVDLKSRHTTCKDLEWEALI